MTVTELEAFENTLFNQLKTENKECLKTLAKEVKLIKQYLSGEDKSNIKMFVNDFNNVVLESGIKKFKLFGSVLEHESFRAVLAEFKQSDILIRACKAANKKAVEWLLTMNINLELQDESGMTALMHAAEHGSLDFAVEKMIKGDGKHVHLVDNNGNNVLFHATQCPDILKKLLKSKVKFDLTKVNNDNEHLLLYSSRYNKMRAFEILNKNSSFDPNLCNCVGKTTAMYLVENARFSEIKPYVKSNKIDPNYKNKFGDSLVSVLIKAYYQHYTGKIGDADFTSSYNYLIIKNYANTIRSLIDLKCNFNVPIDDEGNTPIIVLNMMHDEITSKYLIDKGIVDLSIENKYGENALNFKGNKYPIVEEYAPIAQNWVCEIFYPNKVKDIPLCKNTHRKDDPTSFGSVMHKYNTGGFGTY